MYGDQVCCAYDIFAQPSSSAVRPPEGYHFSAYIFMYDFLLFARRRQFYGFIATQDADPYSHVLAIRGTEGWWEWWDDAGVLPTLFSPVPQAGVVHAGFNRIYSTMVLVPVSRYKSTSVDEARALLPAHDGTPSFADQLENLLNSAAFVAEHPGVSPTGVSDHHFVVTGHSLGGALCTLYVMEHAIKKKVAPRRAIIERICTFASPRVGMNTFVNLFHGLPIDSWRIANAQDLVPDVPPGWLFGYRHVEDAYIFTSENVTKYSPSCWHDMRTYLHLLDAARPIQRECLS